MPIERDSAGKCYIPVSAREYIFNAAEVKALRWNGREIRNALQTAVALAETEAAEGGVETVTVTEKHLRAVAKMSFGFRDFLRKHPRGENPDDQDDDKDDDKDQDDDDDDDAGPDGGDESDEVGCQFGLYD